MNNITETFDLTHFNSDDPEWYIVNDGVMGGRSESSIHVEDGKAFWEGRLSLENNGGFASTRMRVIREIPENLSTIVLKVKGDGNTYNLRIRTNENFDGMAFDYEFETQKEKWIEIKIPLNEVQGTYRGRTFPDKVGVKSHNISQIGILIGNKQEGEFRLVMDSIKLVE